MAIRCDWKQYELNKLSCERELKETLWAWASSRRKYSVFFLCTWLVRWWWKHFSNYSTVVCVCVRFMSKLHRNYFNAHGYVWRCKTCSAHIRIQIIVLSLYNGANDYYHGIAAFTVCAYIFTFDLNRTRTQSHSHTHSLALHKHRHTHT